MLSMHSAVIQLQRGVQTIATQLSGLGEDQVRWRPEPNAWSMLEVLSHLLDEEREDFRLRLDITLNRPSEAWPAIHPSAWVSERSYNTRALERTLFEFRNERSKSLDFLHALRNPDWMQTHLTVSGGTMSAGDLLCAWMAHDLLHVRQLNELHYAWHAYQARPYKPDYAGEWA